MTPELNARATRAVALITGAVLAVAACTGGGDTGTGDGTDATAPAPSAQSGDNLLARLRAAA